MYHLGLLLRSGGLRVLRSELMVPWLTIGGYSGGRYVLFVLFVFALSLVFFENYALPFYVD